MMINDTEKLLDSLERDKWLSAKQLAMRSGTEPRAAGQRLAFLVRHGYAQSRRPEYERPGRLVIVSDPPPLQYRRIA